MARLHFRDAKFCLRNRRNERFLSLDYYSWITTAIEFLINTLNFDAISWLVEK